MKSLRLPAFLPANPIDPNLSGKASVCFSARYYHQHPPPDNCSDESADNTAERNNTSNQTDAYNSDTEFQ